MCRVLKSLSLIRSWISCWTGRARPTSLRLWAHSTPASQQGAVSAARPNTLLGATAGSEAPPEGSPNTPCHRPHLTPWLHLPQALPLLWLWLGRKWPHRSSSACCRTAQAGRTLLTPRSMVGTQHIQDRNMLKVGRNSRAGWILLVWGSQICEILCKSLRLWCKMAEECLRKLWMCRVPKLT